MTDLVAQDELIRRLHERATDPARRVDNPPSVFWSGVSSASLSELTSMMRGLAARTYRVLTRLRYQGPPYRLSAGQLAENMGLSSGAMTNRLDRLEQAGLVRRVPDPTTVAECWSSPRRPGMRHGIGPSRRRPRARR